jgi:hypothetical protein
VFLPGYRKSEPRLEPASAGDSLEFSRNAGERLAHAGTQRCNGADDDDGNQSSDQSVLDSCDGALVHLEGKSGTDVVYEHVSVLCVGHRLAWKPG